MSRRLIESPYDPSSIPHINMNTEAATQFGSIMVFLARSLNGTDARAITDRIMTFACKKCTSAAIKDKAPKASYHYYNATNDARTYCESCFTVVRENHEMEKILEQVQKEEERVKEFMRGVNARRNKLRNKCLANKALEGYLTRSMKRDRRPWAALGRKGEKALKYLGYKNMLKFEYPNGRIGWTYAKTAPTSVHPLSVIGRRYRLTASDCDAHNQIIEIVDTKISC